MKKEITIFWFRRDLRLHDNAGLYQALSQNKNVYCIFIYDLEILDRLEDKKDRRVDFISQVLTKLNNELVSCNSALNVYIGKPSEVFKKLYSEFSLASVYANHDYEPYARQRDGQVEKFLATKNITFNLFKDQVIFDKDDVLKSDGTPYSIFTPYSRRWKELLKPSDHISFPCEKHFHNFIKVQSARLPSLSDIGFDKTGFKYKRADIHSDTLKEYKAKRDHPAVDGTTRISIHLRFGTVSIRTLVQQAIQTSETWLNELIWREFYMMILWHFPHVANSSFKRKYDGIKWRNNEKEFELWCSGRTGFPIVDAGIRELNETGFMHNRVRMIVSSFLVKDLLIDWRWGEAYFALKLNDYDLSANNGGWQWAAGCGCDAAPYFRVFNPTEQQKKFDPEFKYIKKWIPEFGTDKYPEPMLNHAAARIRALDTYKETLQSYSN